MPDLLPPSIQLLILVAAGRALLSLLPAGRPGGHSLGELPATLAASWLLGMLVQFVTCRMGLPVPEIAIGFTLAVTVGWRLFGTGALVPLHVQRLQPRGWVGWLPWILPVAWLVAGSPTEYSGVWMFQPTRISAFVLIERGLRQARCTPGVTASALGIVGLLPVLGPFGMPGGLTLGAAAAVAAGWILRAERRALWLSAGVLAMSMTSWLALALPVAVLAATPAPSRRRALLPLGLGAAILVAWLLHRGAAPTTFPRSLLELVPAAFVSVAMITGRRR